MKTLLLLCFNRAKMKCVRVLFAISVLCGAALCYAQPQRPPVQGVSVTTVILEHKPYGPTGRVLTVGLQNNTDKTIVAYGLHLTQLDAQQNTVFDSGVGFDYLSPDGSGSSKYIQAGQPAEVPAATITDERVVSVKVSVVNVVYADRTYEGVGGLVFDGRREGGPSVVGS